MEDRNNRHLIIPRGLHFSSDPFHRSLSPQPCDTIPRPPIRSGGSIFHRGSICEHGHAIPRCSWDLDLFTDMEVFSLSRIGVVKSPISGTSYPHAPSHASRVEPDLSTRKRGYKDSLSRRHPVSTAAGSLGDLGKL